MREKKATFIINAKKNKFLMFKAIFFFKAGVLVIVLHRIKEALFMMSYTGKNKHYLK